MGDPSSALAAFTAFTFAGAALGGTFVILLGIERYRLFVALMNGDDLTSHQRRLHRTLTRLTRNGRDGTPAQRELQLLCAILSMERANLAGAEVDLDLAHDQSATRALKVRLALLRGGSTKHTVPTATEHLGRLGELIDADNAALIELASQRVPSAHRMKGLLPTTRARVLAAQHRDKECLAVLGAIAPSRVDAMCTLFPDDRATRLWLRRSDGPYR